MTATKPPKTRPTKPASKSKAAACNALGVQGTAKVVPLETQLISAVIAICKPGGNSTLLQDVFETVCRAKEGQKATIRAILNAPIIPASDLPAFPFRGMGWESTHFSISQTLIMFGKHDALVMAMSYGVDPLPTVETPAGALAMVNTLLQCAQEAQGKLDSGSKLKLLIPRAKLEVPLRSIFDLVKERMRHGVAPMSSLVGCTFMIDPLGGAG
ncbi:MAG: hypothetical protein O3A01_05935, partial [bacterium]|nr:hypothetical protein [bacterium]